MTRCFGRPSERRCEFTGRIERRGAWYCLMHDPEGPRVIKARARREAAERAAVEAARHRLMVKTYPALVMRFSEVLDSIPAAHPWLDPEVLRKSRELLILTQEIARPAPYSDIPIE